ncbi:hypothetical protein GX50_08030 [[Emmonsia] crescens]|uniref:Uncharacterized protein n=1 Tax=[Emmonsia] crescens TaxID=73230 RepID=A0A2B7Z7U5_9EURO|nr:hypothetical protein GX50_08030 [Emmonsia crescens]
MLISLHSVRPQKEIFWATTSQYNGISNTNPRLNRLHLPLSALPSMASIGTPLPEDLATAEMLLVSPSTPGDPPLRYNPDAFCIPENSNMLKTYQWMACFCTSSEPNVSKALVKNHRGASTLLRTGRGPPTGALANRENGSIPTVDYMDKCLNASYMTLL